MQGSGEVIMQDDVGAAPGPGGGSGVVLAG